MATFTSSRKGGTTGHGIGNNDRIFVQTVEIDLAEVQAANPTFASGDLITALAIPADSLLLSLDAEVTEAITSDGTSETVNIGDTGDDDRFVAAATTLTAGTVLTQELTTNPLNRYSAADALNIKFSATTSVANLAGKINITAVFIDCTPRNKADYPATVNV